MINLLLGIVMVFTLIAEVTEELKKQPDWKMYPDVFQYKFDDKKAYERNWNSLQKPQGFLFSDGMSVKRVPWYQYAWEKIKGWFRYTDHCDSKRVGMALQKILYFGYIHGLNQSLTPSDEIKRALPAGYFSLSQQAISPENSLHLQKHLELSYQAITGVTRLFGDTYQNTIENIEYLSTIPIGPEDANYASFKR